MGKSIVTIRMRCVFPSDSTAHPLLALHVINLSPTCRQTWKNGGKAETYSTLTDLYLFLLATQLSKIICLDEDTFGTNVFGGLVNSSCSNFLFSFWHIFSSHISIAISTLLTQNWRSNLAKFAILSVSIEYK